VENFIGTTAWMAPEMFENDKEYTEKVDVYSFAIVLWELVTRCQPYAGMANWDIPNHVGTGARPELLPKHYEPHRGLKDLITACWAAHPKRRPAFDSIASKLRTMRIKLEEGRRRERSASVTADSFAFAGTSPNHQVSVG
jgi:serine/threonine protein kinase